MNGSSNRRAGCTLFTVMALGAITAATGCDRAAAKAPPKKPDLPVTAVDSDKMDVPDIRRYPGNTEAVRQATLEARITGFLEERRFEEGTSVSAGDTMFVLSLIHI